MLKKLIAFCELTNEPGIACMKNRESGIFAVLGAACSCGGAGEAWHLNMGRNEKP